MVLQQHGRRSGATKLVLFIALGPSVVLLLNNLQAMLQMLKSFDLALEDEAMHRPPQREPQTQTEQLRPLIEPVDPKDSFSACLLTMDDTHFLIEWIAYHYHALPLRHLIVAVDPKSKTSPSHVFDRWRSHGMVIEEVSDMDFMENLTEADLKNTRLSPAATLHRIRQRRFYEYCMQTHKAQGRTWTALIDADEYLTLNTHTRNNTITVEERGSVMKFIQRELVKNETESQMTPLPCMLIPRLRYGSKESTPEQVSSNVPRDLNGTAFQTLRFRKHVPVVGNEEWNGYTKAIIDVSRVQERQIRVNNPHRPLFSVCGPRKLIYTRVSGSPLVLRHYLGTWEQFSFRDDVRKRDGMKNEDTYKRFEAIDAGDDDGIRPWIKGFVEDTGYDAASELLEGVGDVSQGRPISNGSVARL